MGESAKTVAALGFLALIAFQRFSPFFDLSRTLRGLLVRRGACPLARAGARRGRKRGPVEGVLPTRLIGRFVDQPIRVPVLRAAAATTTRNSIGSIDE